MRPFRTAIFGLRRQASLLAIPIRSRVCHARADVVSYHVTPSSHRCPYRPSLPSVLLLGILSAFPTRPSGSRWVSSRRITGPCRNYTLSRIMGRRLCTLHPSSVLLCASVTCAQLQHHALDVFVTDILARRHVTVSDTCAHPVLRALHTHPFSWLAAPLALCTPRWMSIQRCLLSRDHRFDQRAVIPPCRRFSVAPTYAFGACLVSLLRMRHI
ncbi:hypothetical protein DFH06DRAFT_613801 [Mycena polygramma]|nr:hypothetical protein DFH06DRAFT_613801 [Mycena polygramma]